MVVIDTNVIYSSLLSQRGASYLLLEQLSDSKFDFALSASLVFEYEEVLKRNIKNLQFTENQLDEFLDSIVSLGKHYTSHFLWRPYLKDPKDDMVLELAVVANAKYIITFNLKDFVGVDRFGIEVIELMSFLRRSKLL
jgi:putative PIN family toxin of toxin-antitoxin system